MQCGYSLMSKSTVRSGAWLFAESTACITSRYEPGFKSSTLTFIPMGMTGFPFLTKSSALRPGGKKFFAAGALDDGVAHAYHRRLVRGHQRLVDFAVNHHIVRVLEAVASRRNDLH